MTHIHSVILDIDGTLIDSNDAHAHAWQEALHEHGYDPSFEEIRQLIGMGSDNFLPSLIDIEKESAQGQQISNRRGQIFQTRYLPRLHAFPQVRALLIHMQESGITLAVGSSATQDELEKLLEIANIADLIEEKTSADEAANSKPEPDIVQVALNKLGCSPAEVLMLGDTPYDIEAAKKVGVSTIALRCGGWDDAALAEAVAIYNDPADLLNHFATSPFRQTSRV